MALGDVEAPTSRAPVAARSIARSVRVAPDAIAGSVSTTRPREKHLEYEGHDSIGDAPAVFIVAEHRGSQWTICRAVPEPRQPGWLR